MMHYRKRAILFGLVAIVALIGYLIWSGYQEAINLAQTTSRNYAAMIEARVDATFRRAEAHITELVRDLPEAALNKAAVPRYASVIDNGLDLRRLHFPELVGLRVWDANGDLLYASESKTTKRVNIKERDYYRVWQEGRQDGVFYSAAVVSIITGRPAMFIAQALRGKRGELLGIVSASVELEYFQKMFGSLDIGKSGSIAVYRSDNFSSVVRWPAVGNAIGFELPRGTPTREAVAAGKQAASFTFASAADGVERIYSLRVLDRYPFFVASGIGRDDALEGWRMRSLAVASIGLLLLLLLGSLLLSLSRAERTMKQLNADLSATMKAIPDLLFELDDKGKYIEVWASSPGLLAAPKDVLLSQNVNAMLPAEAAAEVMSALKEAERVGFSYGRQIRIPLPQGDSWFELSTAAKTDTEHSGRRYMMLSRDITERKQMEEQIRQLAFHDHLTQLPNRHLLCDRLSHFLAATKRSNCYGAVLFLDLDNFKSLNDKHGHELGDLLLIEVAERLGACVREVDTVGRFGGDEFVVLLSELDESKEISTTQARVVAEKICAVLAEPYRLTSRHEGEADVTVEHHSAVSIGVTLFMGHAVSQDNIVSRADSAMYRAKEAGRNQVFFYDSSTESPVSPDEGENAT